MKHRQYTQMTSIELIVSYFLNCVKNTWMFAKFFFLYVLFLNNPQQKNKRFFKKKKKPDVNLELIYNCLSMGWMKKLSNLFAPYLIFKIQNVFFGICPRDPRTVVMTNWEVSFLGTKISAPRTAPGHLHNCNCPPQFVLRCPPLLSTHLVS